MNKLVESFENTRVVFTLLCLIIGYSYSYSQVGLRYGNSGYKNTSSFELNYSKPKTFKISSIKVEGNKYLDPTALKSISGLKVGDEIKVPGDGISNAIKKLWKQGLIGNIEILISKIEGDNIDLLIKIKERPRLTKIEFYGLNSTQESEILDQIDLIRGRILTDVVLKNTRSAVTKHMYDKGFLNCEVFMKQVEDTLIKNSVILEIDVKKNQKVKVHNIEIEGDSIFAHSKLKKKLKNTSEHVRFYLHRDLLATLPKLFKPKKVAQFFAKKQDEDKEKFTEYLNSRVKLNIFKSSKYLEKKFDEDLDNLISFYNSKGYRDAAIISDSTYSSSENLLDIKLKVDPGQKYYFRNIDWSGNYVHNDDKLERILGISKGDVYDLELVNKKLNFNPNGTDISSLYMDDGYLFFSVDPVETKIIGDSIDVEMRIREGGQATISKIIVEGNDRTNDHVIYRELRTIPGEKFSRSKLIRTQRELSQLGYFNPEKINPIPIPNPVNETVDIKWELEEQHNDQIQLSGGYGGVYGFIGTLAFTFNNFSARNLTNFKKWKPLPVGDGQKFSLSAQAQGPRYQNYSVSFTEPWLGGKKPNSFGLSYNHTRQASILADNTETGRMTLDGITVSLGRRLTWPDDYFTQSTSLAFQRYDITFEQGFFGLPKGNYNTWVFNHTISRNSIDNPMFPRRGSLISLNTALTPPYSLFAGDRADEFIEYHKWMFDTKNYLNIVGNLVLETRAHFGIVGNYSPDAGPVRFERFIMGGSGLTGQNFVLGSDIIGLRGYQDNSLNPVSTSESGIRGGTAFAKYVFELRYPISLNPSATIYALAFAEGGNNWSEIKNDNPTNVLKSNGFGVRIFMPAFGLLGIDAAYGYDNDNRFGDRFSSNQWEIHFSINQSLR